MFGTGNNDEVRRASPAASTNGSLSIKRRKQCDILRNADSEFSELCQPVGDNFHGLKLQIVNSTYVYTSLVDTKNHLYGTVNVYAVSNQSSSYALHDFYSRINRYSYLIDCIPCETLLVRLS